MRSQLCLGLTVVFDQADLFVILLKQVNHIFFFSDSTLESLKRAGTVWRRQSQNESQSLRKGRKPKEKVKSFMRAEVRLFTNVVGYSWTFLFSFLFFDFFFHRLFPRWLENKLLYLSSTCSSSFSSLYQGPHTPPLYWGLERRSLAG